MSITATVLAAVAAALLYPAAIVAARRRGRGWPLRRWALWATGLACAVSAVVGPLAEWADTDLRGHMVGHVLLGMLGPLLLVLAAPVTLALRALPVAPARRLARLLRSAPVAVATHPVAAALLSVGGLWVLYRTGLYEASMHRPAVHALVHAHVLLAGCLFASAFVGPDPNPHRTSVVTRAVVLGTAIAAHDVLAKLLYAEPLPMASVEESQVAAQIMYYGGAPVELAIVVLLGREWLARQDRRRLRSAGVGDAFAPAGGHPGELPKSSAAFET